MPGRRRGKLGAGLNVRGRAPGLVGIISWAVGKTAAPLHERLTPATRDSPQMIERQQARDGPRVPKAS